MTRAPLTATHDAARTASRLSRKEHSPRSVALYWLLALLTLAVAVTAERLYVWDQLATSLLGQASEGRIDALRGLMQRTLAAELALIGALGLFVFWPMSRRIRREIDRQSELRHSNDLLLQSVGEGVYGLDAKGVTSFVNAAAARMLGWDPAALLGRPQHDVVHHHRHDGSPYPREHCPMYATLDDGERRDVEGEVFWRKDGSSFPVEYVSSPIRENGEIVGAVVTFRDATEKQRQTAALALRSEELESANRELQEFAHTVSHDLRAPLRAIDGFTNILVTDYLEDLPEQSRRYLDRVRHNVGRMGQLIDALLDFSRLGRRSLRKRPIDPAECFRETATELAIDTDPRIHLSIGDVPQAEADPDLMRVVLRNLLSNAVKFSRDRDPAEIEFGALPEQNHEAPVYFLRDNGVGFEQEYSDKIFGVFQRLHRAEEYEGTGIGLSTARRVIERHGGWIRAEGKPDQGATFYFALRRTP